MYKASDYNKSIGSPHIDIKRILTLKYLEQKGENFGIAASVQILN